jgi:regulator of sirC expression with transglutaminase-like and TPR domain
MGSADRETAARARFIVEAHLLRDLTQQFQTLADTPEDKIDLEHGMWLIARLVNPLCEKEPLERELDKIAQRVRRALDGRHPRRADPQEVVAILARVMFVELGFAGNTVTYHHPDNSSLERVLATRKGLPILVSHVVVSVAQRVDVPIVGLAIPGRYMAKYDGDRVPDGFPKKDVLIDPFGGRVIQEDDIRRLVFGFDPQVHLLPSAKLATLVRMLNNLESHFRYVGKGSNADRTRKFRDLLMANMPEEK